MSKRKNPYLADDSDDEAASGGPSAGAAAAAAAAAAASGAFGEDDDPTEFLPPSMGGSGRGRPGQSRDAQIYGVFGGGDDDDDSAPRRGLGGGRGRGGGSGGSNLMAGMNFVSASSGPLQPPADRQPAPSGAGSGVRSGLGASADAAPAAAAASSSAASEAEAKFARNRAERQHAKQQAKAAAGRGGIGAGAAAAAAATGGAASGAAPNAPVAPGQLPTTKRHVPKAKMDKSFGAFEAHTKGFGSRMLEKMGFTGRLGRREDGVVNPIIPQLRPQLAGLGAVKEVNESEARNRKDMAWRYRDPNAPVPLEEQDSDDETTEKYKLKQQAKLAQQQQQQSAAYADGGSGRARKTRVRTVYRDASQIVGADADTEMSTTAQQPAAPTNIIWDYTKGPVPRAMTLDQISSAPLNAAQKLVAAGQAGKDGWVPPTGAIGSSPELLHNLQMLVDLTLNDKQRLDREIAHHEQTLAQAIAEREALEATERREKLELSKLETALRVMDEGKEVLDRLSAQKAPVERQLDACAKLYAELQRQVGSGVMRAHNLHGIVLVTVYPLMRTLVGAWQPLDGDSAHSALVVPVLARWKLLLAGEHQQASSSALATNGSGKSHGSSGSGDDLYEKLCEEIVVPRLRLCLSSQWAVRDNTPSVVRLVESLRPVLSAATYRALLHENVLSRVKSEVDHWNPRADRVPIDHWVVPWVHLFDPKQLAPILKVVRDRLGFVLGAWHPSDPSAFAVVTPWAHVWSAAEYDSFTAKHITPKLVALMRGNEFEVSPAAQKLEPFQWFTSWAAPAAATPGTAAAARAAAAAEGGAAGAAGSKVAALSERQLVSCLVCDGGFFAKWYGALRQWLVSNAAFDEVSRWYMGWRSQFPAPLKDHGVVKTCMSRGLDLINAAVSSAADHDGVTNTAAVDAAYRDIVDALPALAAEFAVAVPTGAAAAGGKSAGDRKAPAAAPAPAARKYAAAAAAAASAADSDDLYAALHADDTSVKDALGAVAEQRGITFVPNTKRGFKDGKQIWTFGHLNVYIDRTTVYAQEPGSVGWKAIALGDLIERVTGDA